MIDPMRNLSKKHILLLLRLVRKHKREVDLSSPIDGGRVRVLEKLLKEKLNFWKVEQ